MKKKEVIKLRTGAALALAMMLLLVFAYSYPPTGAFVAQSANYKVTGAITNGGSKLTSSSFININSIGQSVIGYTSSTSYKACLGFICLLLKVPQLYDINIQGNLIYKNGTRVENSDITVNATYLAETHASYTKTDSYGNFFTTISGVSERMAQSNFSVSIYVKSAIEAIYQCVYNTVTDICS